MIFTLILFILVLIEMFVVINLLISELNLKLKH